MYLVTRRRSAAAACAAVVATVVLGACSPQSDTGAVPSASPSAPSATASQKSADEEFKEIQESNEAAQKDLQDKIDEASESAEAATQDDAASEGEVPDVVGMNHATAQRLLRGNGFMVNEEDASPQGRWVIVNSGWKVCRQDPGPGTYPVGTRVAIYSVKLGESCP
ncbi:PASTA domain-containing protein [Streptomyces sp. cg35]|uniref:PASTA domain-containing protein n=1 Tax=Streptomyces sp. cg35 TaxID=3421650 RepID=UPI003D172D47